MDIVRFKGGLGNQMFQYALLKALSARGRNVKGNLGYYVNHPEQMRFSILDVFDNISIEFVSDQVFDEIDAKWKMVKNDGRLLKQFKADYENRFFWVEESDGEYDENIFKTRNCTFVGYWQTERYFQQVARELRKDFVFKCGEKKLEQLKNKLKGDSRYVSVHIRRGDYLNLSEVYGNLEMSQYYLDAILYIEQNIKEPIYVFFSDDISWVKKNFHMECAMYINSDMFEEYHDWYDMCLMSYCAHNIIANSSFSWWGAWLNSNPHKIVVAPKQWLMNSDTTDIWCDNWVRL